MCEKRPVRGLFVPAIPGGRIRVHARMCAENRKKS
jgi:hypothetical protein